VIEAYLGEIRRVLRPAGTFQVQMRSGSDSARQQVVRRLPRTLRVAAGVGLRATGVLRVTGDVDTWLGCVVPPAEAIATLEELGLTAVERLPDDGHAPGMGYWVVGRQAPRT
jgi:hypothetical protein